MRRPVAAAVAVAALVLLQANGAAAVDCSAGLTFGEKTKLEADYTKLAGSNNPCIKMLNGADLDLNGHEIRCIPDPLNPLALYCDVAVEGTTGSKIRNKSADLGGGIRADPLLAWSKGVLNADQVSELVIEGALVGIEGAMRKVQKNVITNVGTCIDGTIPENSGFVKNNFCEPTLLDIQVPVQQGIVVDGNPEPGTKGPKVQDNLVVRYDLGIVGNSSTNMRIQKNVLCAGNIGAPLYFPILAGFPILKKGNVCCETVNDADCELTAPFKLP